LLVFIEWAWSYVTYERSARLITGSTQLPGWTDLRSRGSDLRDSAAEEINAVSGK
jgi:hypothetical protein